MTEILAFIYVLVLAVAAFSAAACSTDSSGYQAAAALSETIVLLERAGWRAYLYVRKMHCLNLLLLLLVLFLLLLLLLH